MNLINQRFGRLLVCGPSVSVDAKWRAWPCLCDCGNETTARTASLRAGVKLSCGCLLKENRRRIGDATRTHGGKGSAEYRAWCAMKERCYDSGEDSFVSHGARGIRVCDRWLHDFAAFRADVGPRPTPGHSIDRIDNDGNYEPGNVRWATQKQQQRNRRDTLYVTLDGRTHVLADLADARGLPLYLVRRRLKDGWPIEAVLAPIKPQTHCRRGHEFTQFRRRNGGRLCKECVAITKAARKRFLATIQPQGDQ